MSQVMSEDDREPPSNDDSWFESAKSLHEKLKGNLKPLKTFNESLDKLLGGPGIPMGSILEISGAAGCGKTQLCLQLCSSMQIPSYIGGLSGKAVYIDTEGSFMSERMKQIAEATKKDVLECLDLLAQSEDIELSDLQRFQDRDFLDNIYYRRVDSMTCLLETVEDLSLLLARDPDIKLIIVDSIAFHFRYILDEEVSAQKDSKAFILAKLCQTLNNLAANHSVAVVITNHITTKFKDSTSFSAPALGETFAHFPSQRLIITPHGINPDFRVASLTKSSMTPTVEDDANSQTTFCISASGVRDVS